MDKPSNRTFMVELMEDKQLLNKYKFVLAAPKVNDLKVQLREKLQGKGAIQKEDKITLKDVDDFELASDDEVADVVADGKLRVYLQSKKSINSNVPSSNSIPSTANVPTQPTLASSSNQSNAGNQVSNQSIPSSSSTVKYAVDSSVIEWPSMTIPSIPSDQPKELIIQARIPQIRKAGFSIPIKANMTFLELSEWVVSQFSLPNNFKAIIYDARGQPLLFNLDLMNQHLPKLALDEDYFFVLTATTSTVDQKPILGMFVKENEVLVQINHGKDQLKFQIDLENTLSVLKFRVFEKMGIHPSNQILKYGNNPLINDLESLKAYGLQAGSIMELTFKNMANLLPATYSDKFYYKDIQHIHSQKLESTRLLRANLLVMGQHLSDDDKLKLTCFVRENTGNYPLAFALKCLFNKVFASQAHRIALEEGLFAAICDFLKSCDPLPKNIEMDNVFSCFRSYMGFCLQSVAKAKADEPDLVKREAFIKVDPTCYFTMKPIVDPVEVQLDNKSIVVGDRNSMEEQILKGFTYETLKAPKKQNLKSTKRVVTTFELLRLNSIDNKEITACMWIGSQAGSYVINAASKSSVDKYDCRVNGYPELKVHQPLEIKNKGQDYLLFLSKQNEQMVFINKNKDINNPHNIYDVITGEHKSVNLDLMVGAGKTENLEEHVDLAQIKPIITREPREAIAVLMDISGSMGGKFFNEKDLNRIGAVKSFFEAFAYRTIAYNFEHVVSLILFDNQIEIQCDFTEAIYDFNRFVANAKPRGSTRLYDTVVTAVHQLKKFKQRYPECLLRILALTDGQDNGSSATVLSAAKEVVEAGVVMDSFAVGANCTGLKNITLATGGKCYLTRELNESLKLFEQETVLSIRSRNIEEPTQKLPIEELVEKANFKAFDMPTSVHSFKMPQVEKPAQSAKEMANFWNNEDEQKKIAGSGSLKRIVKEIKQYEKNPHPFVAIFPCSNINLWKILLLGPKETPYENGLFLLYVQFPGDYPFKAPEMRFITPIYHCNMNQQGRICHSVFDRNYSPALTFRQIIDCVYGLILTPEPEDPLDNVIASYFLSDYQKYLANAKEATKEKASKSSGEIVEELFGKISDDIERQKKSEEIEAWIKTAKSFN